MSKEIQIFKNEEFGQVRTMLINNEPWFVGKDVAEILGYSNTRKALLDHVDEDDKCKNDGVTFCDSMGRIQKPVVINESGLYSLILSSKLPNAKKFKKWVTSEVLPSIRKHEVYMTDNMLEKTIADPDYMIGILTALKEEKMLREKAQKEKDIAIEEKKEAEEKRDLLIHTNKTYTTSEIAKELGLNSAQKLNQILHIKKIQYKRNNTWIPYAKYAALGYTSTKQMTNEHGIIVYNTKWTGKGRDFILNLFKNEGKKNQGDLNNGI